MDLTVEDHGQKMHVTDFAITGLSFEPQTVWLDDDRHLFAIPGTWFAFLRESWEKTNDQLYAIDLEKHVTSDTRTWRRTWRSIQHTRSRSSTCACSTPNRPSCGKIRQWLYRETDS